VRVRVDEFEQQRERLDAVGNPGIVQTQAGTARNVELPDHVQHPLY
jgi:hypothetical protein